MYRIDKFLEYYNSLNGASTEIEKGIWVYAKPIPFYYGFFTKKYWPDFSEQDLDKALEEYRQRQRGHRVEE